MDAQKRTMTASVISVSEQTSNSIYMSIKMRMCSTQVNRNNEAVTEEFINEIASNQSKYVCIPLCADVSKLSRKDYKGLGHMLNRDTGEFYSQIIGGFVAFEKVNDEFGTSLIGEARVAKRNKKVCQALSELYEQGNLNFSFEILAKTIREENGVVYIEASEDNALIGMAVVSMPAYPEAKALALVAEVNSIAAFEKAEVTISEIDFHTVSLMLWQYVCEIIGEQDCWYVEFEKVCPDCAIFYITSTGQTFKIEYVVQDNQLVITDMYEVVYQRKVSEKKMTLEEAMAKITELENAATASEADHAAKVAQFETDKTALENEKNTLISEKDALTAEKVTLEADKTALSTELETVKAEVETLKPFKVQAEALEAEKVKAAEEKAKVELEAKKEKAKKYAELNKLDVKVELIANAIENLDYETLADEVTKIAEENHEKTPVYLSAFSKITTSGSAFGGIFDSVQK